ncbi:hypothetical protein GCM10023224_51110 [Streptomonospora halophila]|uniref:Uncharacterized protein n=1 Tax=Streptomonospora halophila TaxID=427369 RepID=A0ABP9H185_9ACTN
MAIMPYKGRNKPEVQKRANRSHSRLRGPGERANAQLPSWRILRKLRCSSKPGCVACRTQSCLLGATYATTDVSKMFT